MLFSQSTIIALLPFLLQTNAQASGSGKTTRYWDCCKPSCSWPGKLSLASGATPVRTCSKSDSPLSDYNTPSGCNGGGAFMCTGQSPWAINDDLAYGFAAAAIQGGSESSWCCGCYELTFTSTAVAGKKMIVQVTNTGGDLGNNHFDIQMPGGGVGIFDGCTPQFGTPSTGWGQTYGGISSRSQCDAFPSGLKAGCYWRFDWFMNADNPNMTFKEVTCPSALTNKTGCVRNGQVPSNNNPTTARTTTSAARTTTQAGQQTTTTSAAGNNNGGSGTSPKYGQCGGQGWTGPTTCASGSTCVANGQWYSQCL